MMYQLNWIFVEIKLKVSYFMTFMRVCDCLYFFYLIKASFRVQIIIYLLGYGKRSVFLSVDHTTLYL